MLVWKLIYLEKENCKEKKIKHIKKEKNYEEQKSLFK